MTDKPEDRKVITPVFGREGGADILTGDFAGKDLFEVSIGGFDVSLVHRSLFEADVDGFVIPQFANKLSTGGIAGAATKIFGDRFNEAYDQYMKLNSERQQLARVVSYREPEHDKYFFHTVTVATGHLNAARNTSDAVQYVLALCEKKGLTSIGFPAMCTGVEGELEDEQSAKVIANALHRYGRSEGSDLKITVAISGWDSQQRFAAFKKIFADPSYFEKFDPAAEVGTRQQDVRRRLYESGLKGELLVDEIVDTEGQLVVSKDDQNADGAKIYRLPTWRPGSGDGR